MEITNVTFRAYSKPGNNVRGFASITLDDELVLTGIKLVKGHKGLFVAMPAEYWASDENYHDIFFPITAELREEITDAIIEAYKDAKGDEEKSPKKKSAKKTSKKSKKAIEDEEEDD